MLFVICTSHWANAYDEPYYAYARWTFYGLAPIIVEQIFEIIMELNKSGMTILLVEQNAYQALQIAHRGYVIQTGEMILQGKGSELIHNEKIKEAYLA